MKLYYVPASPPSRSVLMTIRCLELDVEVITVDMPKGEHKSPEFLKLNPLGKVPVLVDGDFVLNESRAIMTYLVNARKPGSSLYPSDPKKRAIIDSRLYFDAGEVFNLIYMSVRPIFQEGKKDIPEDIRIKFKAALGLLESFLSDSPFFAGDEPSLADISILSNIVLIKSLFRNIGNFPNLEAWFRRCATLPGYEENLQGGKSLEEVFEKMGIKVVSLK